MNIRVQAVLASLLIVFGGSFQPQVTGDVKLPNIISDGAVLQRNEPINIWGWAEAGEEITVEFGGESQSAVADDDGKWKVVFPKMDAGGPHTLSVTGKNRIELKDILIGEVWLCSGQSNMEWTVKGSRDAEKEIASADWPQIRHIKIHHTPASSPQDETPMGTWQSATPDHVGEFTAAGYYFARKLHQELNVPIGLIGSNWGGTRIEPWTSPAGFASVGDLKDVSDNIDEFPKKNEKGNIIHQSPTALFNGMIAPISQYSIGGTIWYQGESNMRDGDLYGAKMQALIHGLRTAFDSEDMPFYYVQLAPFNYRVDPEMLPRIWQAQCDAMKIPHTGMAVITDIGNVKDIHPRNKQDVGLRLALWALAKTYEKSGIVHSGPHFKSMSIDGSKARIAFAHVGGGLATRDGEALDWFEIAGEDGKFYKAVATIDGDKVVVVSEAVASPTAVRFGWHQEASPNLINKDGLPASPFLHRSADAD